MEYIEDLKEPANKLLELINELSLLGRKSLYENQLYFYVLRQSIRK